MTNRADFARILRWYPPTWRERYGEGLLALLEDTHGDTHLSLFERFAMVRAGLGERLRESGLRGPLSTRDEKVKAGAHLVFASWAVVVVAGAIYAKSSEHFESQTPVAHRTLAVSANQSVLWAAMAGLAILLGAGVLAAPACFRFWRAKEQVPRRLLGITALTFALTAAMTEGLSLWAHHLSSFQRNGGSLLYGIAFLLLALAVVASVATGTSTVIAVTRRVTFTPRVLRVLGVLALALTVVMATIVAGVALWWINEALYAPATLRDIVGNGLVFTSAGLPPTLLGVGVLLLFGLAGSLAGSLRVLQGLNTLAR